MSKCIVINAVLDTTVCPLEQGACTWQHSKTRECKYHSSFEGELPSPEEIANLVGVPVPDKQVIERITERIKTKFIKTSTRS